VLPYWYSVVVDEASRGRNHAVRAFLDIFQHRMLSHFYRAWEKSRSEVGFERGAADQLAPVVRAIVGLNAPGLEGRMGVSDTALLFYSGLLGPSQRSAIGLEQLLEDYFGAPVRVEQFSGGWFELSPDAFLRLGEDDTPSAQLGVGAVVGTAIWNEQARVRIRVGPLARDDFERFLPSGPAHGELRELVHFYADEAVDFDLQLVLRQDDVPPTVLGQTSSLPLGWGSWLCTRPSSSDKDQVVFSL
jgi:type VI secretion system protein ImpH